MTSVQLMFDHKTQRKKIQHVGRHTEGGVSFSSWTRNKAFQFERHPASFFGCADYAYKVRDFSYKRAGQVRLRQGSSRRFWSTSQFA